MSERFSYGPEHFVTISTLKFRFYWELVSWCEENVAPQYQGWHFVGDRIWFNDPNNAFALTMRFRGS